MNDEKIYLHFQNLYKNAVIELDEKYGKHHICIKRMEEDIAILKAEIEILKRDKK